ncbi:hypothetical protein CALCODRAFT_315951 [Calocera cornea HHB12733]|uniref:F-box domain-containing protein n=1 Tax=Calocera cornea HHB12733 TaxID=1353952 RepID=A0A165FAD2_9BASI|nr:hypothetical protein CALCODRAFT_315951 [Calocera cornea HHB12733]
MLRIVPTTSSSARNPFYIPELLQVIVSLLDDPPDLLHVACTNQNFTEIALRELWREPGFDGSPLLSMLRLFPDDIAASLAALQDPNLSIPRASFNRFDYYSRFVRILTLWHHGEEAFIALVLTKNRPGVWLFPSLEALHLGAAGEELETAPVYLTPTLKSLYLNHWDGLEGREIIPNENLKKTLRQICSLPRLSNLDLADTLYTPLEHDAETVRGFVGIAGRLETFRAQSFLTLNTVFAPLSRNPNLRSVLLNALLEGAVYVTLDHLIIRLGEGFPGLRTLGLYCSMQQAMKIFADLRRRLPRLALKITSSMDAHDMLALTACIASYNSGILSLRISSAGNISPGENPSVRLPAVLAPLRACKSLVELEIVLGFNGEQMMQDPEIDDLFRSWPDLESCTILNDPEGDLLAVEGEETSFGLTLDAISSAARHCRHLMDLTLPFVDTSAIPDVVGQRRSTHPLSLQLSRTHVHNHAQVQKFVSRLWPAAELTFGGCDHYAGMHMKVMTPFDGTERPEWLQDGTPDGTSHDGMVHDGAQDGIDGIDDIDGIE